MKKIILLLALLSTNIFAQEYEFNIPMKDKPHKVIKFSSESGKTYNWDRCFGQTTQLLSEDGISCEKVINSRSGFTGSVDVCVSATQDYLTDPYCFAMCSSENITWGNCTANVGLSENLETRIVVNTNSSYVGNANLVCNDGIWNIQNSDCNEKVAVCDNNTFGGCEIGVSAYTSAIGASNVTWNCISGETSANCNKLATAGTTGVCGSSHGTVSSTSPTENLCNSGTQTNIINGWDAYTWFCMGAEATQTSTIGTNDSCSTTKTAVCDNSTFQGCTLGTASGYTSAIGAATATWNCTNGISTSNCSKAKTVGASGLCGSANGKPTTIAPSSNLCSTGTASSVTTGTNNFTWSCNGVLGTNTTLAGTNESCSANKAVEECDVGGKYEVEELNGALPPYYFIEINGYERIVLGYENNPQNYLHNGYYYYNKPNAGWAYVSSRSSGSYEFITRGISLCRVNAN